MNTVEFLTAMWPLQGYYVVATLHPNSRPGGRPWFRHKPFETIEAAAAYVAQERDKPDQQVFYALQTYAQLIERTSKQGRKYTDVERIQTNAAWTRLFAFDLDVGESTKKQKKYKTRDEALRALAGFIVATKLPLPSIVYSGTGVHVYWRLDADLASREWQTSADKLKHLVEHHKLLTDRTTTADASRVLRPIHTWNRKDPANPLKVELRKMTPAVELGALVAALDGALVGLPPVRPTRLQEAIAGGVSGIVLAEGLLQPPSIKKLARACPTFRLMASEAKSCNGTVWRATLELLRHTTGGEAACHKASKDHPEYDEQTTQERLDRYRGMGVRGLGPPRCATLEAIYGEASPCPVCPHYGSPDSSPIAFARREPDQELPPETPPPPQGFRRTRRGIEAEIVKVVDDEEEVVTVTIYPYDLYPLRIVDDPLSRRKAIEWRATVPIKGDIMATLPVDAYTDENKMVSMLAHQGVTIEKRHGKKMGEYVSLYIRELQQFAAEQQQVSTWGWDRTQERFILPDGSHGPDGIQPVVLAPSMQNSATGLDKRGSLEGQLAALRFYDHEAYVRQQAMVCLAAVAPLFYLTGHYGVLVNLSGASGASKSTALFMAASVWGIPDKVVLNGTAAGMTQNARMTRLATLANLPVILDDVTDMDPAALKQTAMGVTQPGSRIGNQRDGTERVVPDSLKSTVMLMSSNPPLHSLLSQNNVAGDAGSMRTVDMACVRLGIHTKQQADEFLRQIKQNCGHVGPIVIDYILKNRRAIEALLRDTIAEVEQRGGVAQQERFWSTAISMAVFGARLLRQLGLVRYDPEHMLTWFVEHQLPAMRGEVQEAYTDPVAALQGFLADNVNNFLQVSVHNGVYTMLERPRGSLIGRQELGGGALWISVSAFRSWCVLRKLPSDTFIRDLLRDKVAVRERMDLTRHIVGIDLGVAATLKVNLHHEAMADATDSGGKILEFRAKNGPKALVTGT